MKNIFELVKNNEYGKICDLVDEEYTKTKKAGSLRNKIYALLFLSEFDKVIETEEIIIADNKGSTDSDFISYGIALWNLKKYNDAILKWKEGESCKYTDAAGGIEILIIIYFGYLKLEDSANANKYLKKVQKVLTRNKNSKGWPNPLAAFLLGNISFEELKLLASDVPGLKERNLCQAYFVKSVKEIESANYEEYYKTTSFAVSEFKDFGFLEDMYFIMKAEVDAKPIDLR
jgi:hypothetical protein